FILKQHHKIDGQHIMASKASLVGNYPTQRSFLELPRFTRKSEERMSKENLSPTPQKYRRQEFQRNKPYYQTRIKNNNYANSYKQNNRPSSTFSSPPRPSQNVSDNSSLPFISGGENFVDNTINNDSLEDQIINCAKRLKTRNQTSNGNDEIIVKLKADFEQKEKYYLDEQSRMKSDLDIKEKQHVDEKRRFQQEKAQFVEWANQQKIHYEYELGKLKEVQKQQQEQTEEFQKKYQEQQSMCEIRKKEASDFQKQYQHEKDLNKANQLILNKREEHHNQMKIRYEKLWEEYSRIKKEYDNMRGKDIKLAVKVRPKAK
ncbi:unnamed protein product, partial [Didymodactylos carnosus]